MDYNSRRCNISEVAPGMELGRHVLDQNGRILLSVGTIINDTIIKRLMILGIEELGIREPLERNNSSTMLEEENVQIYLDSLNKVKLLFNTADNFETMPIEDIKDMADKQIIPLVDSQSGINCLNMERERTEYFSSHCVNVALLSGKLGRWLGYSDEAVRELVLAGLLHDIGKKQIPEEVLNKSGELSAGEIKLLRLHSTYSYSMLKKVGGLTSNVSLGILQHHERLDGSGYPGGFSSSKIHDYAKIIAIADTYDAMTSDRSYGDRVTPFSAIDALAQDMFSKLDAKICSVFLGQFQNFILGNKVQLENGLEGELIYLGEFLSSSPLIKSLTGEIIKLENWRAISQVKPLELKKQA